MRDIFSNASKVLVWLGISDGDTNSAMTFFRLPQKTRDDSQKPMPGLLKLYRNAWWSRMWVVQEVFVAREDPVVCCGHECASWESVTTTLLQVCWDELGQDRASRVLEDPTSLLHFALLRAKKRSTQKKTLESLLKATANRRATKPHDHVYALFGLAYDDTEQHLQPEIDYSLPEYAVFQHTMVTVFNSRQDLDWLLLAARGQSGPRPQGTLPSWCVDFSAKDWPHEASHRGWSVNAVENRQGNREEHGATAGREMAPVIHDRASGTIKISGTRIGLVKFAHMATTAALRTVRDSGQMPDDADRTAIMQTSVDSLIKDIGTFIIYSEGALESRLDQGDSIIKFASGDIWKIASSGKTFESLVTRGDRRNVNQFSSRADGYALLEKFADKLHPLWSVMTHKWNELLPKEPEGFTETALGCYLKIAYDTAGKCYFTTDAGYIGLAGHKVEEGDVVCILFGCKLPAILRPQPDGSFTLVTYTYTHDVMDGEFLAEPSSVVEETFMLR
jgi:hypothetical protein